MNKLLFNKPENSSGPKFLRGYMYFGGDILSKRLQVFCTEMQIFQISHNNLAKNVKPYESELKGHSRTQLYCHY